MSSLTVFKTEDGIEIVIDDKGECYYPGVTALARVCSIRLKKPVQATQVQRVLDFEQGVTDCGIFNAKILTEGGLQGVTLIPRKIGTKAIKKYNFDLYEAMAEAGHLVYLHQLAGYKSPNQEQQKPLSVTQMFSLQCKVNEEYEQRLASIESDVAAIKDRAIAAEKELKALPPSTKNCPSRTTRNNINTLVRGFCHGTGINHQVAWNNLYREFRDRHHVDLKIRAANGNCKPLDLAETLDVLEDLYAVAQEIFAEEGESI